MSIRKATSKSTIEPRRTQRCLEQTQDGRMKTNKTSQPRKYIFSTSSNLNFANVSRAPTVGVAARSRWSATNKVQQKAPDTQMLACPDAALLFGDGWIGCCGQTPDSAYCMNKNGEVQEVRAWLRIRTVDRFEFGMDSAGCAQSENCGHDEAGGPTRQDSHWAWLLLLPPIHQVGGVHIS